MIVLYNILKNFSSICRKCRIVKSLQQKSLKKVKKFYKEWENGLFDVEKPVFAVRCTWKKPSHRTAVCCICFYALAFNNSRSFSFGDNQRFLFVAERNTLDGISFDRRRYTDICDCKSSNE